MADPTTQSTTCARAARDGDRGCAPREIVELLTDDTARAVYHYLEEPATVSAVTDALEIPESTAYRKVAALHDAGLLAKRPQQPWSGGPVQYAQAIEQVSVTYDEPIRIECVRSGLPMCCELPS